MFNFFRRNKDKQQYGKLPFAVDVHAHVLPGIDDGAKDLEKSIELIRKLQSLGIEKIIATPHITEESFPNNRETISQAWAQCNQALKENNIDVDLQFSAEYRMDGQFEEMRQKNALIPFPKDYLLIENSFLQPYLMLDDLLFNLQAEGYSPLMAHVERYGYYYKESKTLEKFKQAGCLFQCNILSFTGYYGRSTKEFVNWLLSKKMIDFLGTDVHNIRQLNILEEFLNSSAYHKLYPLIEKNEIKNNIFLS